MGRFYNVSAQAPQFIEGLYTPPWELMDKALSYNQQGYDNALATTNLFQDIDVNSINDPVVKEQVNNIKKYYEDKSNSITKAIQENPMEWKKSKIAIQNLGRELQEDIKRGDIARIQNAHQSMQNFVKEHEEYAKKNPGLFNQAYSHYLNKFREDPLRMGNFDWDYLVNPIDEDKINKRLKDIVADAKELPNGMWKVGVEEVSKDKVLESAKSQIYNSPENQAFIQQQVEFKNPDYYDADYAKATGGNGYYEQIYYSNTDKDENGKPKILNNEEVEEEERKYLEAVTQYVKDKADGKKNLVTPERNYIVKEGAVKRLLDNAVNENSYTKTKVEQNPVYFASANLDISRKGQDLKERIFSEGVKNNTLKALNTQKGQSITLLKQISTELSYIPADTKDPIAIARRGDLIKQYNNALATILVLDEEIFDNY